jgi:hypothetical protein
VKSIHSAWLGFFLLAGCPTEESPQNGGGSDNAGGNGALSDAGSNPIADGGGQGGPDAGVSDAGVSDAGASDGGASDGGMAAITLCDIHDEVFAGRCLGCHSGDNEPNLTLDAALTGLVGVQSFNYPPAQYVVAGDPESSLLYRKIAGTQTAAEGSIMPPPPAQPVPGAQTDRVRDWIAAGANVDCAPPPQSDAGPAASDGGGTSNTDSGPQDAGPPPDAGTIPSTGLFFEHTFNQPASQTSMDTSGNGRDGRLGTSFMSDASDPIWVTGILGDALDFDGNNDFVALEDFDLPADFTLMAWVYPTDASGGTDRIIVNKHNDEIDFRIGGDGHFSAGFSGTRLTDTTFDFTALENRSRWYHLVYVFDGSGQMHRIYRNGVEIQSAAATGTPLNTTNNLWFGRHSQFDFGTFLGRIDQVRLYDRVVDLSEITEIYNLEKGDNDPGPFMCTEEAGLSIYERRIEPLVVGGQPGTCNQCHLSGVALTSFVQDTPCQSMACLISQGLVDVDDPTNSSILGQILLAQPDSELITPEVIQAEHDGFLEWILYSAACQDEVCGAIADPCNSGTGVNGVDGGVATPIGECSEASLAGTFETMVYSSRGRCAGCHDPTGPQFQQQATLWIDPSGGSNGALFTMYNLIGIGAIDANDPTQSNLLLKPLAPEAGGVAHGGGPKFADTSDPSYVSFLNWLNSYAQCFGDGTFPPLPENPNVGIIGPEDGRVFTQSDKDQGKINFYATAIDPQDGELTGPSLVWTSNVDTGWSGTGTPLENPPLSPGVHVITLTGTDSDANASSDSITVTVP